MSQAGTNRNDNCLKKKKVLRASRAEANYEHLNGLTLIKQSHAVELKCTKSLVLYIFFFLLTGMKTNRVPFSCHSSPTTMKLLYQQKLVSLKIVSSFCFLCAYQGQTYETTMKPSISSNVL